jgi:hypothetical protein
MLTVETRRAILAPMPKKTARAKGTATRAVAADNANTAAFMLRMEPALLAALDAWADKLNAASTGPKWSRTDVIRAALARAVKERGEQGDAP